jgi:hypothetical protein
MPGNLALFTAADVFPISLSSLFEHSRAYTVVGNEYQNGEQQVRLHAGASPQSAKRWQLRKRLTAAQITTLRTFFLAHKVEAFYFYDPLDTAPKFHPDPTGVSAIGRYKVVFASQRWSESMGPVRGDVDLELVEVA